MRKAREKIEECGGTVSNVPDLSDESVAVGVGFELLCCALGRYAIIEWEGVLDEDDQPAPVAPETIAILMKVEPIADAFYRAMTIAVRRIDSEKKRSKQELSGTSPVAQDTATDAWPLPDPVVPAPTS